MPADGRTMTDHDNPTVWVPGDDAARWSAHDVDRPPVAAGEAPAMGRVRVFPTYTFTVSQPGTGGIGLGQTITITDWRKQGPAWATAEAHRQVTAALGEPAEDAPGGAWWMGPRPKRDTFRWHPLRGTPRDALPVDPDGQPGWQPDRAEPAEPDGEPLVAPEHRERALVEAEDTGAPFVTGPADVAVGDKVVRSNTGEVGLVTQVDADAVNLNGWDGHGGRLPGAPGVRYLRSALQAGELQRPEDQGSLPDPGHIDPGHAAVAAGPFQQAAGYEDGLPAEVQRRRFERRRAHQQAWRGDGETPAPAYSAHRDRCEICRDLESGGDGVGRRMRVQASGGLTFVGGVAGQSQHAAVDAVLDAVHSQVAAYSIPDDLTGVLDVDSMIGSLAPLMEGTGAALGALAETFGSSPVHTSVVELLADFAGSFGVMAEEARSVHAQWRGNPANDHDLRRASGEIPRAALFNVPA